MIIGSQRQSQVILFIFKADHYIDFFFHYQVIDAALKVTNKNLIKKKWSNGGDMCWIDSNTKGDAAYSSIESI